MENMQNTIKKTIQRESYISTFFVKNKDLLERIKHKIIKQIKIDTEKFLKAGGVIQQIPEGEGSLEIVFQDKN